MHHTEVSQAVQHPVEEEAVQRVEPGVEAHAPGVPGLAMLSNANLLPSKGHDRPPGKGSTWARNYWFLCPLPPYTHARTHTQAHAPTHRTYTDTCTHIHTTHSYTHTHPYVPTHIHMHISHTYIHTHMHTSTCTPIQVLIPQMTTMMRWEKLRLPD